MGTHSGVGREVTISLWSLHWKQAQKRAYLLNIVS